MQSKFTNSEETSIRLEVGDSLWRGGWVGFSNQKIFLLCWHHLLPNLGLNRMQNCHRGVDI